MLDSGLEEVENPSQMLLSGRPDGAPGTCVTCVMEGVRPVLAEIQALLAPAQNLWTSNGALLVYMTNYKYRNVTALCHLHQSHCAVFYLSYAAGRAL